MIVAAGGANGAAGPLGLLIILLVGVVTVFLIRNMNGRLRRLPREFPEPPAKGSDDSESSPPPAG